MKKLLCEKNDIEIAAQLLRDGKLVAFPTETVYGVASIYRNEAAFIALNKLKRRPPDKPYTMMISSPSLIKKYAVIDDKIDKFLHQILPGSVTVLLKGKEDVWDKTIKDEIIGIRIPTNKEALDLLKCVNLPLLVPSLNRNGELPKNNIKEIELEFANELDAVIVGEIKENIPSTVISLVNGIHLIREGKVPFKELERLYRSL